MNYLNNVSRETNAPEGALMKGVLKMATTPKATTKMTADSAKVLNAIRSNATTYYKDLVPKAVTGKNDSIRAIGNIIMSYEPIKNEFLSALYNRIARVIIQSKLYSNPLAMFKKGILDLGEITEEVFVNLATPFKYNPELAETNVFKRVIPDVRAAFHNMNYQIFYKVTIQNNDIKLAFTTYDGVTDLIAKITESMYTAAAYDEFQTMKYLIADRLLKGQFYPVTTGDTTVANATNAVTIIKGVSNTLDVQLSDKYNLAGVYNTTLKSNQYILIDSRYQAVIDVNVLAAAFNMSLAEFAGHMVLIDGFGELDTARLNQLLGENTGYREISQDEMNALNTIGAVLVDENFFMCLDNLQEFTVNYNGEGLYWNYFFHLWKTISSSPFSNAIVFTPAPPVVSSVAVNPSEVTLSVGSTLQLGATVTTEYFAPQAVTWSSDSDNVTVTPTGFVSVNDGASGTVVITATSVFDSTKTATCTITIA